MQPLSERFGGGAPGYAAAGALLGALARCCRGRSSIA